MKLYWGLNSIPELQGLPKDQQRQIWRTCFRAALRQPRVWGSYALMAVALILTVMISSLLIPSSSSLGGTLWIGLCSALGVFTANQLAIPAVRPLLAMHRQALEPKAPGDDDSYSVPPAV